MLGLVTTKSTDVESVDDLLLRIEEASKYIPVEQLTESFASTRRARMGLGAGSLNDVLSRSSVLVLDMEGLMNAQRKKQFVSELNEMGRRFWAGEAEICRQFWGQPRSNEEQSRWLRLQVFKEMYGSGLTGNPDGLIRAFLDELRDQVGVAETRDERHRVERSLRVLREEYNHFKLFADILENVTGEPVRQAALKDWQLDHDQKLQKVRQNIRESEGKLGELAIMFTEGGGSAFFYEARKLTGDSVSEQIARASETVYTDELEHGEHGAMDLENEIDSDEDWGKVRHLIVEICQQRLRMRYDMFGLPIDELRIQEISDGKIEPLLVS